MSLQISGLARCSASLLALLLGLSPALAIAVSTDQLRPGSPLQLAQAQDPRKVEADRLLEQGIEQFHRSQFEPALRSWQQALSLYRVIQDRRGEEAALGNLGIVYDAMGNYARAIDYQQQRLAVARASNNRQGEGIALGNLGLAYHSLGDYAKALGYYQQSLVIARKFNDRRSEGAILGNLGNTYYALGEYATAIDYQQQGLAIDRETKDRLGEGQSLGNLGNIYYILGDYAKAHNYYQQLLSISRAIKNRAGEANALGNLGITYQAMGDYTRAIDSSQQLLTIARQIKDRLGEGNALGNLGVAYYALGDYAKAIDYQQQRLVITRAIRDRRGEGVTLGNLGAAYHALGNHGKAIDYLQQRLAIAREIKDRLGEGKALSNLGAASFQAGRLAEAESQLIQSIQIFESLREKLQDAQKISIADIQRNPYDTLQEVLIAQNKVEPALEIAERGRARAFAELLAQRTQGQAALTIQPIQIATIQQVARTQKATLVEYANLYDEQLFIWVVKPTGEVAFRQVDLKPLQQQKTSLANLVTTARCLGAVGCEESVLSRGSQPVTFNLAQGDRQFGQPPITTIKNEYLQQLHKLLIDPIADLLPKNPNDRVIFVPQGSLFLLPFAALQDDQGQYLLEKHTIGIAPSIQVLQLTRQQRSATRTGDILLVGNPTMPRVVFKIGEPPQPLTALAGAEQEVRAISQLLQVPALIGRAATKTVVINRMPKARIIHLATHGLLDDIGEGGVPGAIALGPSSSQPNDGLLSANELLDLKLKAELVVLSACDTGRGKITGDGVIGLSRALITAGVPSVIVSLWKVPDAPTAELMTSFYRYLNQGQDKATALRQAMLDTKQKYPDPIAWAPFELIGEAQ
ncbi:Fis family transcriptional regulator [Leptolyngbya sp. 'hensonii']|uniref:CHAT domain-containing protein n=1 Tax=Leptolyngbya sp. 'hensonii' TaxID=1922337 RepID=UPI00094FDBDC|nr:CHAT domain-containing protein [Leptolyngbya sp. 'hensonii']OLP18076.1 Fis family transcriptional regulator [Leptolyngbya sp. 'hensonii']